MQTIAVYREPKIKTYGFQEDTDLSLLELAFKPGQLSEWGLGIHEIGDFGVRFELVLIQYLAERGLRVYLFFKRKWEDKVITHIRRIIRKGAEETFYVTSPVELIYFYGPHFGDRYGIADVAFEALNRKAIPVLAAVCSGSAIYLVFPERMAQEARTLLAETFEVPQTIDSSGNPLERKGVRVKKQQQDS